MAEEIMNLISLLSDEIGEEEAIKEVLKVLGKKLAMNDYNMGEAMSLAEMEIANGWQQYKTGDDE